MSELAKRREAQEGWVSRSALRATVAGGLFASVLTFALGYLVGRGGAPESSATVPGLVEHVPGRDLVELLADVERSTLSSATEAMRYPEIIDGGTGTPIPPPAPASPTVSASVPGVAVAPAFEADPVPTGRYHVAVGAYADRQQAKAVREHLRAAGQTAWWQLKRVQGAEQIEVAVGGFGSLAEAEASVPAVAAAAVGAPAAVSVRATARTP